MVIGENRAKDVFLDALELSSLDARQALLDERCLGDERLRREVEELLAEHANVGSFLHSARLSGETTEDRSRATHEIGTAIGPYKLLQQIGEGGMGVVFMAEQCEPVRRRVALKVIKPGMDSRACLARFEAERQALALMDHPNIARVFDAGTAEDGRPYFAMELVKGVPITRYCDEHRLSTRRRLELLLAVCRAVQHAHQKGIIHRDLKPSNVLVAEYDHDVVPKIIDFGVAKALSQSLTQRTMFTRFGEIIGTLDYMSPEQAKLNQLDIDTRSDVYSLGVLLYELLTGTTPFDKKRLRTSGLEEVLRIIREEEPPRPSTRLNSSGTLPALAASRATDAKKLPGLIRGDLDWIVMRAMAKERSERYQTAEALATDVQRYLNDEPIAARRPSTLGRVRRFVRRKKVPVALTALVVLASTIALALGIVAYVGRLHQWEQEIAIRETEARQDQERRARQTMPTIKQLVEDGRVVHAFRLAKEVQEVLPDDPAFRELWNSLTVTVTFDLQPPGTKVSIRDWDGVNDEWLEIGQTPLVDVTLPNGDLRFRYEKEGYITREFHRKFPEFLEWAGPVSMTKDWGVPEDMALVYQVQAAGWNGLPADLGDFLVDRYEVTNRQYQEFAAAGGYEKPAFWEDLEFIRDGEALSWQEAMEHFRDETGRPGPAVWRDGTFPEGEDDYPVQGVSWFEAAAYARFAGKSLPTVHHWWWAADSEIPGHTIALSNFSNRGPDPKGVNQGIGRFDTYDMAGNVKEWCWNMDLEGRRCLRGGAWNEAGYRFLDVDVASPWDRSETHGFRCVRYLDEQDPRPETLVPWQRAWPYLAGLKRRPIGELAPWFDYTRDLQDSPLDPKPIHPDDSLFEDLRHEIVRINAAYNNERFDVHLFVPRDPRQKYETILFVPGAGTWLSQRFARDDSDEWEVIERLARSGRMVCLPIQKGTFERGTGTFLPNMPPVQAREIAVAAAKDVARTVDYLCTRPDVDPQRLVYFGYSSGAVTGLPVLAMYPKFQAAILVAGGYPPTKTMPERAVLHPYHFTPHVTTPVLMINGRYDTMFPYQTAQVPFLEDLGSASKKHITLDSGHNPPLETVVEETDKWLREVFGAP